MIDGVREHPRVGLDLALTCTHDTLNSRGGPTLMRSQSCAHRHTPLALLKGSSDSEAKVQPQCLHMGQLVSFEGQMQAATVDAHVFSGSSSPGLLPGWVGG